MIDTLKITHEFSQKTAKEEFLLFVNYLTKHYKLKEKIKGNRPSFISYSFTLFGVLRLELCKHEPRCENGYFIKLVINPKYMLQKENYNHISLSEEKDYPAFEQAFNNFILAISKLSTVELPALDKWIPTRLDYAINIFDKPTSAYIYLFNKGKAPPNAKLKSPLQKCFKFKDTSYWRAYTNFTLNFYNKIAQIKQNKSLYKQLLKEKIINKSTQILRLEVQLSLKDKHSISSMLGLDNSAGLYVKDLWNNKLAYNTLHKYLAYTVGLEDFFNKQLAQSKLRESEKGGLFHTAKEFMDILNLNNRYFRGAQIAFCKLKPNYDPHYLRDKIMPVFKRVQINPITIPSSYQIQSLANPIKFLQLLKDS